VSELDPVFELFEQIANMTDADREEVLSSQPPTLAHEVRRMLVADAQQSSTGTLQQTIWEGVDAGPPDLPGYTILGEIGRGGMGMVYAAEQAVPLRKVAIKVLHPWLVEAGTIASLRAEAQAMASLQHPGIPQVLALIEHNERVLLVMEHIDGAHLHRAARGLPLRARLALLRQVSAAVAHAHSRSLLHLDLKPGNVLVDDSARARVLDFGLARLVGSEHATRAGTPAYMAPEQKHGERVDARTDVYALGVLICALVSGEAPRPDAPLPSLLDRDLGAIVRRATQADPDLRYPSVEELDRDLAAVLEHRPVAARSGGLAYRAGKLVQRRPLAIGALVALVVVLVAATAFSTDRAVRAETARAEAESEARRANATTAFLSDVFLQLNPRNSAGEQTLLDAALTALQRLDEGSLRDAPLQEADIRNTISASLLQLGQTEEAEVEVDKTLALLRDSAPSAELSDAWFIKGVLRRRHDDLDAARSALDRSQVLAEAIGDVSRQVELLHSRAVWQQQSGDFATAAEMFERALTMKQDLDLNLVRYTNTRNQLGYILTMRGDHARARALFTESLAETRRATDEPSHQTQQAQSLAWLAWSSAMSGGDLEAGLAQLDESAALFDDLHIDHRSSMRSSEHYTRTQLLLALGRFEEAEATLDVYAGGDRSRLERGQAWQLAQVLLADGRDTEALALAEQAFAAEAGSREGSGAWAWGYTVRGLVRARLSLPGAAEDLRTALSVWEPRFTPRGPRPTELRSALDAIEGG